ncbi:hypothetical protein L7F22_030918 [Adiantum nelumboides]|nr:hypothetical protein [Adiantum nelumboides]
MSHHVSVLGKNPEGDDMDDLVEEKTIRAVYAQMKSLHTDPPVGDVGMTDFLDAMRTEVRRAVSDIRVELEEKNGKLSSTTKAENRSESHGTGVLQAVADIRKEYTTKLQEDSHVTNWQPANAECGAQGHQITECPRRRAPRQNPKQNQNQNQNQRLSSSRSRPSAGLVPDFLGSADADASIELCRAWGQVRDLQSLVFFDPGARANFITPQLALAEKMGIKTDEMGPAYIASMAALGHEVAVTPLIGKLRLHIQGYVGHKEFYIMPLEGSDVLLDMPWFYNHKAVLDSFNKTVTLENRRRKIVLDVKLKGESVQHQTNSLIESAQPSKKRL